MHKVDILVFSSSQCVHACMCVCMSVLCEVWICTPSIPVDACEYILYVSTNAWDMSVCWDANTSVLTHISHFVSHFLIGLPDSLLLHL